MKNFVIMVAVALFAALMVMIGVIINDNFVIILNTVVGFALIVKILTCSGFEKSEG